MKYLDFDADVERRAKAFQESAREFGKQVVRPAGMELDKIRNPAEVIAKGSRLWEVFRQFRELGYHKLLIPPAFGGRLGRVSAKSRRLIFAELGYADAGLAVSMDISNLPFVLASLAPSREVRSWAREYCEDKSASMVGCWAVTEPDHGTDWVMGVSQAGADPKIVPSLTAVKQGGQYVLNGQKSSSVTNGTIATHAVVHVGLDLSRGIHGSGLAICPLDLPGVSKSKPLDKLGKRALNQGGIVFEEVTIPEDYMLIKIPGVFGANAIGKGLIGLANSQMGIAMSGQAQAIVDEAVQFSKEHSRHGRPLSEEQEVRLKLFHMFKMAESSSRFAHTVVEHSPFGDPSVLTRVLISGRVTFWAAGNALRLVQELYKQHKANTRVRTLLRWANQRLGSPIVDWSLYAMASKVLAAETALKVAEDAIQIMGATSLSTDRPLEKMLRDARMSMIEDGTNEALGLVASERLLA